MKRPSNITNTILDLAQSREVFSPRDVKEIMNPGPQLRALVNLGLLLKVGHCLYTLAEREPAGSFSLAQAAARIPGRRRVPTVRAGVPRFTTLWLQRAVLVACAVITRRSPSSLWQGMRTAPCMISRVSPATSMIEDQK